MPSIKIFLACIVSLVGCSSNKTDPLGGAPVFEKGFQPFPSPRDFDPPGTLFRIDNDGVRHPVANLAAMIPIVISNEAVPKIARSRLFDLATYFSWIGGVRRGFQAEIVDSASIELVGARREQAFEADLRRVVDSAAKIIDWKRAGNVYLITETLLADSVQIRLASGRLLTAGDSLRTDSATAHGVAVHWSPRSAVQLALRFPKPYRVLYKAERLSRKDDLEPSQGSLLRLPASDLTWKSEQDH